ncbi:Rad4-domain-containing protein, partial [Meira miltonrushii]
IVTPRDRMVRLATHKWTVLSLIAHTRARNAMINDESLRDRLYGLVPNAYLEKLRMIHKKKIPLQTERVRLFEIFLEDLTEWWRDLLKEITLFGIGNSTKPTYMRLADVQHRTRSSQDMLSYVEKMSGSREDNAQLFAALCRSLGIPARLVISIQCPGWTASPSSTKSNAVANSNETPAKIDENDYRGEKWRGLDKPLEVKYQPKLRAIKAKPLKPTEVAAEEADAEPIDTQSPPTMWVEVFSKPWQKWITVDPIRGIVTPTGNRRMEPSNSDKSNRLVYVLAFEEDGHARDVTARYTRTLYSRISRMRPPSTKKGGEETDWWSRVVASVQRQERFARDFEEDEEMQTAASREPMPSSVAAFKDHPVYALEKHLKRDEVIFPAKQAGTFQGTPVFLRANVIACRSSRQWYNEGRVINEGEDALKWVKSRGYTLANKRAEEEARQQGMDGLQEGLYAPFQTEVYTAPPVVDGKIPTNAFGNVDLFVDSMLPPGGVHIPYNGAGKVAKKLEIPYAEAVVGFEFRKHRGMPKIKGIVVAEEYGETVTEAFLEYEEEAAAKDAKRKKEQALKAKRKEINAVKIKARLQRDY